MPNSGIATDFVRVLRVHRYSKNKLIHTLSPSVYFTGNMATE